MHYSLRPFFIDANRRAAKNKTQAYTHVVGLGLGVWEISLLQVRQISVVIEGDACVRSLTLQGQYFVDAVAEILAKELLPYLSDVDFSYFPKDCTACGNAADGNAVKGLAGNDITIHFSRRYVPNFSSPSLSPCLTLQGPGGPGAGRQAAGGHVRVGLQFLPRQRVLGGHAFGLGRSGGGVLFSDCVSAKSVYQSAHFWRIL